MNTLIFYDNGTIFQGEPEEAPARGVQLIAQDNSQVGYTFETCKDYYIYRDDHWVGVDQFGLYDYLIEPGWKRVLFGRTIDSEEYYLLVARAKAMIKEIKTAWLPGERIV